MSRGCYRGPALAEVLDGALFRCVTPADCSLHAGPALGFETLLVAAFSARSLLKGPWGFEINLDACCCAMAAATEPPPGPWQLGHGGIWPWHLQFFGVATGLRRGFVLFCSCARQSDATADMAGQRLLQAPCIFFHYILLRLLVGAKKKKNVCIYRLIVKTLYS